jgi:hypothetical protein
MTSNDGSGMAAMLDWPDGSANDALVDRLLAGEGPDGAPSGLRGLQDLLAMAAVTSPADQVVGLEAALAEFTSISLAGPAVSRRTRLVRALVVALALIFTVVLGAAGAAYAKVLPAPIERWAHHTLHIGSSEQLPSPSSHRDASRAVAPGDHPTIDTPATVPQRGAASASSALPSQAAVSALPPGAVGQAISSAPAGSSAPKPTSTPTAASAPTSTPSPGSTEAGKANGHGNGAGNQGTNNGKGSGGTDNGYGKNK